MSNIVNNKSKLFLPFVLLAICVINLIFFQPTVSAQSSCQGPPTISSTNLFDVPLQGSAIACESAPQTAVTVTSPIPISITLNGGLMDGNDDPFGVGHVYSTLSQTVINMCPSDNFAPVLNVQLSPAVIGEVSVNVRPGTGSYTVTTNDDQSITQFINGGSSANFTFTSTSTEGISSLTVTPAGPVIPGAGFAFGIAGFSISTFSTPPPDPVTGTITPDPLSACPGTSVNVTGEGWVTPDGMNNSFILLFDGQQVAQQGPGIGCTEQPNLTFTVPMNASPGNHTLTLQSPQGNASTQFIVEGPGAGLAPGGSSCGATVMFQKADGTPLPSPFRIGISAKIGKIDHDRKQSLRAVVSSGVSASDVDLDVSINLKISNKRVSGNIITFDVAGRAQSSAPEDSSIMATLKSGETLATALISVVVPAKLATPHKTTGISIPPYNIAADRESTPPANVGPNEALLITVYSVNIEVTVLDQFGELIGDLYAGSEIEEVYTGQKRQLTNISLRSDSLFIDPVGLPLPKSGNFNAQDYIMSTVKAKSKEANDWPTAEITPLPSGVFTAQMQFTLLVDGFPITPTVEREITYSNPPIAYIINWP